MNNDIETRYEIERTKWSALLTARTGKGVEVRKPTEPDDAFSYVYVDDRRLAVTWPTEQYHSFLFYGSEDSEEVTAVVAVVQDAIDNDRYTE